MIYQPRSIQPTYKSVDANGNEEISMIMNTNDKVVAYQLTVYDMDNNIIYQGDKENFLTDLYNGDVGFIELNSQIGLQNGNDYKWIARLYQPEATMEITYGKIIEPTTYVHKVENESIGKDSYYISIDNNAFQFEIPMEISDGAVISYNSYDDTITLIYNSGTSETWLYGTKIEKNNFDTLTMTDQGDDTYKYIVPAAGLSADDYHIVIDGRDIWFTTLSDLKENDYITYDANKKKVTQTYDEKTISLTSINALPLTVTKVENTASEVYLKRNINIKKDMILSIAGENRVITAYDINTGSAIVDEPFSEVPTKDSSYSVYSDFIETTPENVLYVRALPNVTVSNFQDTIHTKGYTFKGSYQQSDDVPLVYFLWNLYSITDAGISLLKTSGKVYSANIEFRYDGFKPGEAYRIELICETEYGVRQSTKTLNFEVDYPALSYEEQPVIISTENQGIRVSWATLTSDSPYSLYTKSASGRIQNNNSTSYILWLERNQEIYPNQKIYIGESDNYGIIESYDKNTGKTILSKAISFLPQEGEIYYILTEANYDLNGIEFLRDTPYQGVNSAKLGDNYLVYEKKGGLSSWSNNHQVTMQFRPDENFFYGDTGIYNDMIQIARYKSNDDELNDLIIYARNYDFGVMMPAREDNHLVGGTITSVSDNPNEVYVSGDVDVENKIKYICFVNTGYIEKIESYDSESSKIILSKNLPDSVIPAVDDLYFLYSAVETAFYDEVNNTFVLQKNAIKNPYADYIWMDSSIWDDDNYWVEGGTQIERASENWWKLKFVREFPKNSDTPIDTIEVREGGV